MQSITRIYRTSTGPLSWFLSFSCAFMSVVPLAQSQEINERMKQKMVTHHDDNALTFDSDFLSLSDGKTAQRINLDYFAHKGGMLPGTYSVKVKVNDQLIDKKNVAFKSWPEDPGKLYACVTVEQLARWGIRSRDDMQMTGQWGVEDAQLFQQTENDKEETACTVGGVTTLVPYAKESFDFNKQELELIVPQAALMKVPFMRTPPTSWERGLTALLVNYNYNGFQELGPAVRLESSFLGLNNQLNLMGFRVRNDLTYHRGQGRLGSWSALNLYAQHDYGVLRGGQLTVGQTSSDGTVIEGVPFIGVKIASDDSMWGIDSARYTPTIDGIANSTATIILRQNGRVIYQKNVPQGPFSLSDFTPSGRGDVQVEIREADGSTRRSTMSSTILPSMMRQGGLSYSLSVGNYRGGARSNPFFTQANIAYGMWHNTTLLVSTLISKAYQAVSFGAGVYSPFFGAFSESVAQSVTKGYDDMFLEGTVTGQSNQMTWSRNLGAMSFSLIVSQASKHFSTFSDSQSVGPIWGTTPSTLSMGIHSSYQLSLSQILGDGTVVLSAGNRNFWGGRNAEKNMTLSYNTTLSGYGVTFGYSRTTEDNYTRGKTNSMVGVNVSLPLNHWTGADNVNGSYMYSNYNGQVNQQTGVSGSAFDGEFNYSIGQGWGQEHSGNASIGGNGRYAAYSVGYNYSASNRSWNYGMNGGLVLHQHGITLSKPLSLDGGNALVDMSGVSAVGVGANAKTDWRGFAVLSGLSPYQHNNVSVNVDDLPGNVEIPNNSRTVIPSRGALVGVSFMAEHGYRVLLTLLDNTGKYIPFGAVVALQHSSTGQSHTGIVDEDGQVYLSGLPEKGKLVVTLGDGLNGQCFARYIIHTPREMNKLQRTNAICQ